MPPCITLAFIQIPNRTWDLLGAQTDGLLARLGLGLAALRRAARDCLGGIGVLAGHATAESGSCDVEHGKACAECNLNDSTW